MGERESVEADDVFGQRTARENSFYVKDGGIYKGNEKILLRGVIWSGFDTPSQIVHGAWSGRTIDSLVDQIAALQFNAIQIPLVPETLAESTRTDGDTKFYKVRAYALQNLQEVVASAAKKGLYVVLSLKSCSLDKLQLAEKGGDDAECSPHDLERWKAALVRLATLAGGFPNVVGIDPFNKPYQFTAAEWAEHFRQAARTILTHNPHILVFMDGVQQEAMLTASQQQEKSSDLASVLDEPLSLPMSRLVYAPSLFCCSSKISRLPPRRRESQAVLPNKSRWDKAFGDLNEKNGAVVVATFGGHLSMPEQRLWQQDVVSYLREKSIGNFFYCCLDPESKGGGGILKDGWRTVDHEKLSLIAPLMTL
jgi:endoglucanase